MYMTGAPAPANFPLLVLVTTVCALLHTHAQVMLFDDSGNTREYVSRCLVQVRLGPLHLLVIHVYITSATAVYHLNIHFIYFEVLQKYQCIHALSATHAACAIH